MCRTDEQTERKVARSFKYREELAQMIGTWFGEINLEIWHHGQYRSMNFPYANMMLNQGDFYGREVIRVGNVF